jgi:sortase A
LTGRWTWPRAIAVVAALIGPGVLSYPAAADWYATKTHNKVIFQELDKIAATPPQRLEDMLTAARAYNQDLPNGPLRDPYAVDPSGKPIPIGQGRDIYESLLNLGGDGIMGQLMIPTIGVQLPIYHDTGTSSLDRGVGHLYGSGLPVGGPGGHSVLTAHSGVVGATLFSGLDKVKTGDTFQIQVLSEVLWYQVDDIRTVLPNELDSLRQEPGKDLVTLVTCTPVPQNTFRLLVTGHRIPTPTSAAGQTSVQLNTPPDTGFPWWPFPVPAAALVATAVTRTRSRAPIAAKASLVRATGTPQVVTTLRRPGKNEMYTWSDLRERVVPVMKDVRAPGSISRFANAHQAAAFVILFPGHDGVYTWTLTNRQGHPTGVSAFAFPTDEVAAADGEYWAAHWQELVAQTTEFDGRLSAWWLATGDGQPVLFQSTPATPKNSALDAADEAKSDLADATSASSDGSAYRLTSAGAVPAAQAKTLAVKIPKGARHAK